MKRKILIITAMLAVMVAMTGIAAATTTFSPTNIDIDINGLNPATLVTVTHDPLNPMADGINFSIYDGEFGTTLTNEVIGSWDGTFYSGNTGETNTAPIISGKYQWTFYIKDNIDGDDSTQIGHKYKIEFTVYNKSTGIPLYTGSRLGSATTYGTAIPEFPTVALPVAAVIGLVFFFQQRKNKKE